MRATRRSHTFAPRVPSPSSSTSSRTPIPPRAQPIPLQTIHISHHSQPPPLHASHRYDNNGGQSELCKGVGGPNKKLFYQGWASFLRMAIRNNGTLTLTLSPLILTLTLTLTLIQPYIAPTLTPQLYPQP